MFDEGLQCNNNGRISILSSFIWSWERSTHTFLACEKSITKGLLWSIEVFVVQGEWQIFTWEHTIYRLLQNLTMKYDCHHNPEKNIYYDYVIIKGF